VGWGHNNGDFEIVGRQLRLCSRCWHERPAGRVQGAILALKWPGLPPKGVGRGGEERGTARQTSGNARAPGVPMPDQEGGRTKDRMRVRAPPLCPSR